MNQSIGMLSGARDHHSTIVMLKQTLGTSGMTPLTDALEMVVCLLVLLTCTQMKKGTR